MKYAVIADVHGNYPALRAVLDDAERRGISRYLFAGDYCISNPYPDECITAIRAIPDKVVIRGNEERYLENLIGKDPSGWTDGQMQVSYWAFRNTGRENLEYLLSLPHTADFEYAGIPVHIAHPSEAFLPGYEFSRWGSTNIAKKYADVDVTREMLHRDMQEDMAQDAGFQEMVSRLEKGVYIFGHSHVQWSYRAEGRGVYLINPGSCGLPLDGIRDSIPYTVLEITDGGQVSVEEIRLPFDKAAYIRDLEQTGQFREANVWTRTVMKELAAAKEHVYFFLCFAEEYARRIGDCRRPFAADTWEKAFGLWERVTETAYPWSGLPDGGD